MAYVDVTLLDVSRVRARLHCITEKSDQIG
jgi:hypothetical protein